MAGYSGGTFQVLIRDAYDQDLPKLRAAYPALQKVLVSKAVLPPWCKASDEDMK